MFRDFPGDPVVKNSPFNAWDVVSIPGQGTKIPYAEGQLNLCAASRESLCALHSQKKKKNPKKPYLTVYLR